MVERGELIKEESLLIGDYERQPGLFDQRWNKGQYGAEKGK